MRGHALRDVTMPVYARVYASVSHCMSVCVCTERFFSKGHEEGLPCPFLDCSGVTVVLQWCYVGVTVVLQRCYRGVAEVWRTERFFLKGHAKKGCRGHFWSGEDFYLNRSHNLTKDETKCEV